MNIRNNHKLIYRSKEKRLDAFFTDRSNTKKFIVLHTVAGTDFISRIRWLRFQPCNQEKRHVSKKKTYPTQKLYRGELIRLD